MALSIEPDDLTSPQTLALIEYHLDQMRGHSPVDCAHALGSADLAQPDITLFTARRDGRVLGIGALRALAGCEGEIKSMRTAPGCTGEGIGAAVLDRLIDEARARGYRRISLETGSGAAFEAALRLYRRRGFRPGPPFADYRATDFNRFLHLDLEALP